MKVLAAIGVAAAIVLSACSNVSVQRDESVDLAQYKTYMWVDTRASETDNTARPSSFVDAGVKTSVNNELSQIGWNEVAGNPDVLISYDVLVERSVEQRSNPVYTRPFTRVYYNPYTGRYARILYPSQFLGYQMYSEPVREGTITINMVDAKTDKPVWQAWTTERLDNPNITSNEIARSVRSIFKKFDVASR